MPVVPLDRDASIDVIIPVYNGAKFVFEAINSAATQTLPPKSIIVVDDGSTDETPAVIKQYRGAIPLKYIRQENRGLSAARNAGWRHSQAEFVVFLDADDIWQPEKLGAQVEIQQRSAVPDLQLVYCGYHHIDQSGKPITIPGLPIIHPTLRGRVFNELLPKNIISGSGSAVLVRRNTLEQLSGFDESLRALEDWDMWLRIAQIGGIDFVDQDLVGIRTHAAGMQQDSGRMMIATIDFFSRWLERLPKDTNPPTIWVKTLARFAGNSWPPAKFWHVFNTHMSIPARHRLLSYIRRDMKIYTAVRLLSLPFEIIIRQPWRHRP